MEGTLSKWTNMMQGWQFRYFVLDDRAGLLSYYTSREKMKRGERRGCVRLKNAVIAIDNEDDSTFTITVDGKIFHFQAKNVDEKEKWVRCLEDVIRNQSVVYNIQDFDRKLAETDAYLLIALGQIKDLESRMPNMQNENKMRCEHIINCANSMLEHVKHSIVLLQIAKNIAYPVDGSYLPELRSFTKPINALSLTVHPEPRVEIGTQIPSTAKLPLVRCGSHSDTEDILLCPPMDISDEAKVEPTPSSSHEADRYFGTFSKREHLVFSVKHFSDIADPLALKSDNEGQEDRDLPKRASVKAKKEPVSSSTERGSSSTRETTIHLETDRQSKTDAYGYPASSSYSLSEPAASHRAIDDQSHGFPAMPPQNVPETSYSSSDDEEFHDALSDGSDGSDHSDPPGPSSSQHSCGSNGGHSSEHSPPPSPPRSLSRFIKPDGTLDYDLLYEDTEETNIAMETQGSVVTHLLAQVKIGMDLTKVVLPTFILERRSLLEMYADFFAHPEMFVKIADQPTERDRMVQVVQWYLCSFHAGRKSSFAKKPYNPILGEIFQCHWDLEPTDPSDDSVDPEGPIPWCNNNQLTFIAEQVSHHPPVSAFYAEHYNKRITFNAHVWTKSKFLGLSVCVHNIGMGKIHVIDHNEHYVLTFPNGYGRSILTVPWIELGGSINITCAETGYKAVIDFVTKPFYGGKKHKVMGEIFGPNERRPFLVVNGEWNGVLEAKWDDGVHRKTEEFANITSLTINKKIVRPIAEQEDNESRRVWKEVTAGLKLNNVPHATNAKTSLENAQRMEAKNRKEQGIPWETKFFHQDAQNNWCYDKHLASRLGSASSPQSHR